jgi:hypothetical protein
MDGALGGTNDSSCVNGSPLRFQFHETYGLTRKYG